MNVDPRAASAFGGEVEAYERGRPSYPAGLIAQVAAALGLGGTSTVLDLACGTGKLTRVVAPLVGSVIAVDPSPGMLAELRRRVPGVEGLVGAAERIPLPDARVDAVFVGEAFHWFRPDEACREIARVLRPRGGLALVWNRAQWSGRAWLDDFNALVQPHRRAAGPFPAGEEEWRSGLEATGLFERLSDAETNYEHRLSAEDFVALVASWSWIANLPGGQRTALLAEVRELVAAHAPLILHYRTESHWTRKRG